MKISLTKKAKRIMKLKRNSRNKKDSLKGHKTFFDALHGIVFTDEQHIKQRLSDNFNKKFI